jgi:hypothetical protein
VLRLSCAHLACVMLLWPVATLAQEVRRIELAPPNAVAAEQFSSIRSVRELSDESLLVADGREQRLAVVDWNAGRVTDIARAGGGPGEFQGVGFLYALSGDSTLFTDMFNSRWSLLDHAAIVQTFPEWRPINQQLGAALHGADAYGHVLGTHEHSFSSELPAPRRTRYEADTLELVLGAWDGGQFETIALIKGPGTQVFSTLMRPGRPMTILPGTPYTTEERALLFSDGWIALARPEPYSVHWRTPDGRWIRGAPLPFEEIEVDDREKCVGLIYWLLTCEPYLDVVEGWPETVPSFVVLGTLIRPTLFATPDGSVVITRMPTADAPNPRYDIVDRAGHMTGFISLRANEALIGFGAHSVYVLSKDEFDLQTLERRPWP